MKFNEFINNRRKELNVSIDELVELSGIPKGTISKITAGISTNPTLSTVESLCKALKCSLNDAVGYVETKPNITTDEFCHIKKYRILDEYGKRVIDSTLDIEYERCISEHKQEEKNSKPPIFIFRHFNANRASAGFGYDLQNDDIWQELAVVDTPEARQADFAVEIEGRSMEPTYKDGDIVYIVIASEVPIGKIGLFTQNGKGYIKEAGESYLISHNPDFPNIYPSDGKIECVGRVIGVAELPD